MAYLIESDFIKSIQGNQLGQLQTGDDILNDCITRAEAEVRSHLVQKYLIDLEMTDTTEFDSSVQYYAGDRVYQLIGANVVDIYYGKYPDPLFDLYSTYAINDVVFYNGHRWRALRASAQTYGINYNTEHSPYYPNVFPTVQNNTYWFDLGAYEIPLGTPLNNTTYWTKGDNRDQQLLGYAVDIVLYHIHQRLAPTNIPLLRETRYMGKDTDRSVIGGRLYFPEYCALGWLQACAEGRVTPRLAVIQPNQGRRIRRGDPGAIPLNYKY